MSGREQIELPLFPLPNVVLFPGVMLPLHIFEERYKRLVGACIEESAPLGIVLFSGGDETPSSIRRVGVLARVSEVERLDDGRMNIVTQGEVRFRIARFTSPAPEWRAMVALIDDEPQPDEALASLGRTLGALYIEAYSKGVELTDEKPGRVELPVSASELSFMVSYVLDMDVDAKQRLLETTSTQGRLESLIRYLKAANRRLTEQVQLKRTAETARRNGDLGRPRPAGG
jgi:Lon protease-like protein